MHCFAICVNLVISRDFDYLLFLIAMYGIVVAGQKVNYILGL